jgi:hypothetical protein
MAALCVRGRPSLRRWLATTLFIATLSTPALAADVVVTLDQAKIMRLPERATTIVVGNPLIADLSIQSGGLAVVTGKGYGTTNVIAMDRAGQVLMERSIEVQGPRGNTVVVYRGIDRETYSCTPKCERRITLGDVPAFFDATLNQIGTRTGQASSAGAGTR